MPENINKDTDLVLATMAYNDMAKPAAKEIGTGVGYLAKFASSLLCRPFDHISQRIDHFWDKADKDYRNKVQTIPEENRIEPSFGISMKTIQAMHSHIDNDDLRVLFVNLLVSATDKRISDGVLPSYPSLLADLTSDEAKLLIRLYKDTANPFITISRTVQTSTNIHGEIIVSKHISTLASEAKCNHPKNIEQYLDNLVRLNLIEIPEFEHYSDPKIYEDLETNPTVIQIKENIEKQFNTKVVIGRKMIKMTELGRGLCSACSIKDLPLM